MPRRRNLNPNINKMSAPQLRDRIQDLNAEIESLKDGAWCYMCDQVKNKKKDFYTSSDPKNQSRLTPICRECARKIVMRIDAKGREHAPTKESVIEALYYLNKPFLENVWHSSIIESQNMSSGKVLTSVWSSYIKNIAMVNYLGMTFKDSDFFKKEEKEERKKTVPKSVEDMLSSHQGQDTYDAFIKNKNDVKRLLDYDPFEKEAIQDQPFLYSQLLGLLDQNGDANEDMLRVSASISIVRNFLQANKIDDTLVELMSDVKRLEGNSATIKSLQESKSKIMSNIKDLAAENCLSLKNSKVNTKGANTFTGQLKRLRELNLREKDVNGFDIGTCRGMQQVADISMQAIFKRLNMDDSEWAEIVKTQRYNIVNLNLKSSALQEAVRILLRENIDLRDYLKSKGMLKEEDLIDLDELINSYQNTPSVSEQEENDNSEDETDTFGGMFDFTKQEGDFLSEQEDDLLIEGEEKNELNSDDEKEI